MQPCAAARPSAPFEYQPPHWSAVPREKYSFEVIKDGVVVDQIDLSMRSHYVLGRHKACAQIVLGVILCVMWAFLSLRFDCLVALQSFVTAMKGFLESGGRVLTIQFGLERSKMLAWHSLVLMAHLKKWKK